MFREFFAKSPLLAFPMVSLMLFAFMFAVAVVYVMRRGKAYETFALLPLEKGERGEKDGGRHA